MSVNKKKVLTDSIVLSIGHLLVKLKGLIFIPIVVNEVGMATYGVFIQIIVNKQIFVPFSSLALEMGFSRYTSKINEDNIKELSRDYWTVILSGLILSTIGAWIHYHLAPYISTYILSGQSLEALQLSSLFIITGCLSVQNAKYLSARKHFKLYSIYQIVYGIVPAIGFIYGILTRADLYYGILFYIIAESFIVALLMLWNIRQLKLCFLDTRRFIKFVSYSWALVLSGITGGILSKVDRYFIGYFMGPAAIGVYNIIYSACDLLDTINIPFLKYFGTYLPKDWDEGWRDKVREQLKEGLVYYLILAFGGLISLAFMLEPIVRLILSKDISYINNFRSLIIIIGLGTITLGISRFFGQLIKFREQNYLQLIFRVIAVFLNIVLNIMLIRDYGLLGAGIATFISYLVMLILCNYFLDMNIDFEFFKAIFKMSLAGAVFAFWFYMGQVNNIVDLSIQIGLGVIIYAGSIFLFRAVRFEDLKRRII